MISFRTRNAFSSFAYILSYLPPHIYSFVERNEPCGRWKRGFIYEGRQSIYLGNWCQNPFAEKELSVNIHPSCWQHHTLYECRAKRGKNYLKNMRTLRIRPSFPSCINRKVSDERPKRALEMGDFPLQILETRRQERLAELKAECLDLKHQLSEHSLQAALIRESQRETANGTAQINGILKKGSHSKSMHELNRITGSSDSTLSSTFDESMRRRREERLENLRRELQEFAIKYSIGEYAEKIEGINENVMLVEKDSVIPLSPTSQLPLGVDPVNAGILLRIQRQREQELQRARMELKHLAFRLKHKLEEENSPVESTP
ncbi:unnamed protein product [Orchesella dallaii]|uniref:Uncharacterized protein n=1 Tax=Orchesella dallaii TaxID=48710 RepID=A0ABP1QDV0_9HEXA